MTQFLRDQAIDSEEVVTPLMLDGTYLSRNFPDIEGLETWRTAASILLVVIVSCFFPTYAQRNYRPSAKLKEEMTSNYSRARRLGPMIRQPPCDFLFFIDYYVITRLRAPSGCLEERSGVNLWNRLIMQKTNHARANNE